MAHYIDGFVHPIPMDRLDAYTPQRNTSPFLADRFGREGVIFENAVAAATTTDASHMTIFTSLPPYVHAEGTGPRRPRVRAECWRRGRAHGLANNPNALSLSATFLWRCIR